MFAFCFKFLSLGLGAFWTRGNVVVNKDLTLYRVLFLHMVKMLGLGVEGVYSFNPLFTMESIVEEKVKHVLLAYGALV